MIHRLLHYFTGCWHGYRATLSKLGHGVVPDQTYYARRYKCCICRRVSAEPFAMRISDVRSGLY